MKLSYKIGFKYQLVKPLTVVTKLKTPFYINTRYIELASNGTLHIRTGFAWDGASGWTIDTKSSMRASAVHDALYKLIRIGRLDGVGMREQADEEFYRIMVEDIEAIAEAKFSNKWWSKVQKATYLKLAKARAGVWFKALRIGGGPAASVDSIKKVYEAGRDG